MSTKQSDLQSKLKLWDNQVFKSIINDLVLLVGDECHLSQSVNVLKNIYIRQLEDLDNQSGKFIQTKIDL